MSWWEIKDERAGTTLALVNATHLNRTEARRIGDRISTVLGGIPLAMFHRTARPNPTLVHHGKSKAASWHVVWAVNDAAMADLYTPATAKARAITQAITDIMGAPMKLLDNVTEPRALAAHPVSLATARPRRRNPKRKGRKKANHATRARTRRVSRLAATGRLTPNPKGRKSSLSVPERHMLKIARATLKMTDAGARIMGGPTKAEARDIIRQLTDREPIENRRVRSPRGRKPLRKRTARARRASVRSASESGRAAANPRSELEKAKAVARMWSEREPGRLSRVKAPQRVPKVFAKLGELVSVVYRSDKYDGKSKLYEHKTRRPRPVLAADPEGRHVFIVGGNMKITGDGLVN